MWMQCKTKISCWEIIEDDVTFNGHSTSTLCDDSGVITETWQTIYYFFCIYYNDICKLNILLAFRSHNS